MSMKSRRLASQRSIERRQREDEAVRLSGLVPSLASLRLDIVENSGAAAVKYAKHVVVSRAPALFVLTCGDTRCVDGGFDLTSQILRALRMEQQELEGTCECDGATGTARCSRTITYRLSATYDRAT